MKGTSATLQDEWYIREAAGLRLLAALQSMAAGTGPGEYSSWQSLRDAYVGQQGILTDLRSRAEAAGYTSIRDAAGALIMEIEAAFNTASAAHTNIGGITVNPVAPQDLESLHPVKDFLKGLLPGEDEDEKKSFDFGALLIPGLVILGVIILVRAL
jgi:hypothetical protein